MSKIWENRPYMVNVPFAGIAGMHVQDLPTRGRVSALIFEVEWWNTAAGDNSLNPIDLMRSIEIIHRGSEVIKNLTGIQHAGVSWRRGRSHPDLFTMHNSSGWQRASILVPFGRYPYDREYGLTLDNLVNPQIRFTWNNAYAASGDGAGGFGAPVGDWTVRLLYAPDTVSFRGYIRTTIIDQFLLANNVRHYTEMPKNYKWPRIYIQQECCDFNLMRNILAIEIQADNRAWVPVTLDQWGLQRLDTSEFPQPELISYYDHLNNAAIPVLSYFDQCWSSQCESQGLVGAGVCVEAQGIFDPTLDHTSTAAGDETKLIERGKGYGRMYCIPFCPPNQEGEIDSMSLDSSKYGRIMTEILAGPAIGTTPFVSVILEELVLGM